jgi:hypothetical protein
LSNSDIVGTALLNDSALLSKDCVTEYLLRDTVAREAEVSGAAHSKRLPEVSDVKAARC